MNKKDLIYSFGKAIETNAKYVGVLLLMCEKGKCVPHLIVYINESFKERLEYYESHYSENLKYIYCDGESVIGFSAGNSLVEIEDAFFGTDHMTKEIIAAIPTKRLVRELEQRNSVHTYKVPCNDDGYTIKTEVGEVSENKLTTIRESKGPCTILEVTDYDYTLMTDEKEVK